MEKAKGTFCLELRNKRGDTLVEWASRKKKNHEYHVPEESREEMDVEKPKRCNEDRNLLHPNKQAIHRHRRKSTTKSTLEVTTEWTPNWT